MIVAGMPALPVPAPFTPVWARGIRNYGERANRGANNEETAAELLPQPTTPTPTTPTTLRRSPRKTVSGSLLDQLRHLSSNEDQSEGRGEKRGEVAVNGALIMAAVHANVEINWKSFECYQCPKAFSKREKCVFVFCLTCHEKNMMKVAEMRGGSESNEDNRRRGKRARAAVEMEEVNVCANLEKGSCGRHTWGDLEDLKLETSKAYAWRKQRKHLGNDAARDIAKYCYGCGLIL